MVVPQLWLAHAAQVPTGCQGGWVGNPRPVPKCQGTELEPEPQVEANPSRGQPHRMCAVLRAPGQD